MREDRLLKGYALIIYLAVLLGVGAAVGLSFELDADGHRVIAFNKGPAIEAMLTTALILATFISTRIASSMAREAKEQRELLQKAQYDAAAPVIVFDKYLVDSKPTSAIVYCRNVGSEPVLDLLAWVTDKTGKSPGPYRYWGTLYGDLERHVIFLYPGTEEQYLFVVETSGWNVKDGFILKALYTSKMGRTYVTEALCSDGITTQTKWRESTQQELSCYHDACCTIKTPT